ncbi:MAG: YjfK family protein, partial [Rhodobacteraceae bacterium]|nr:YjfK family protein [Paracoccaceae bacterium]
IMLWYFYDVQYPSGEAEWSKCKNSIRQKNYSLSRGGENIGFERAWFDTSTSPEDPMTYWEEICDDRSGGGRRRIFQTAMLFARQLKDGRDEMLLINMEEPENAERSVAFMIGFPLEQHNFSV